MPDAGDQKQKAAALAFAAGPPEIPDFIRLSCDSARLAYAAAGGLLLLICRTGSAGRLFAWRIKRLNKLKQITFLHPPQRR